MSNFAPSNFAPGPQYETGVLVLETLYGAERIQVDNGYSLDAVATTGALASVVMGPNLYSLGGTTQAEIDAAYAAAANGSTIQVPYGATWNGVLTNPNPNKAITWNFWGQPNLGFATAAGDGDLTESTYNASLNLTKNYFANTSFLPSLNLVMENFNPNFPGPYAGNFNQMAPLQVATYSGPTAGGNTGGALIELTSFGMSSSASYDIPLVTKVDKYGNNGSWCHVQVMTDHTGRVSQAFALWNEEKDNIANGYDIHPMTPNYWAGGLGTRTFMLGAQGTNPLPLWSALTPVNAKSTAQNSLTPALAILVGATDGADYSWYCSKSGITGATQPTWPSPAQFTASIAATTGVMTVTAMQAGSPNIAAGNVLTAGGLVVPIIVGTQISGTTGGTGTYNTNWTGGAITSTGFFAATPITDGSAQWSFGNTYWAEMSCGFYVGNSGTDYSQMLVGFSVKGNVKSAAFDCSTAVLGTHAAGLRLAAFQPIDFYGLGVNGVTHINQQTMYYDPTYGNYNLTSVGSVIFAMNNSGSLALPLANSKISIGSISATGVSNVDFFSSGSSSYDVRLLTSGGTAGTTGQGILNVYAAQTILSGLLEFASTATITSGTAAPSSTQPAGSIYLRGGGTSGARLYVSAGGGTWNPVAGV